MNLLLPEIGIHEGINGRWVSKIFLSQPNIQMGNTCNPPIARIPKGVLNPVKKMSNLDLFPCCSLYSMSTSPFAMTLLTYPGALVQESFHSFSLQPAPCDE